MLTNVIIFDSAFNGLVTVCGRIKYDMNNTYTILTNRVCRAFKSNYQVKVKLKQIRYTITNKVYYSHELHTMIKEHY